MRHVPANNLHTASLFIAQGHHDAFIRRLNVTYRERREILNDALSRHLPQFQVVPSQGGSGAWIKGPDGLDSRLLAERCAARGVLIEPGEIFFSESSKRNRSHFRLGYSAIHGGLIEAGVQELHHAYRETLKRPGVRRRSRQQ